MDTTVTCTVALKEESLVEMIILFFMAFLYDSSYIFIFSSKELCNLFDCSTSCVIVHLNLLLLFRLLDYWCNQ